jgi:guanylate kinase
MADRSLPGILVVLSGPSGVGKTTVANRLIRRGGYVRSVSVTTRARRQGEVEGRDYQFISPQEFERLRDAGELVEHANVHGNWYGTPKQPVRNALRAHNAFLLVIDVQGGFQVRGRGFDSLLIFLAPPDQKELARRLQQRGTEDSPTMTLRLQRSELELRKAREVYDHIVVNEELDECVKQVDALVQAARRRLQERLEAGETLYPGLEME